MKFRIITILLTSIACATAGAQDCSRYHPFQEGVELEISSYNKKGKTSAKGIYKIRNVSKSGGAETATVQMELFDEKGKSVISTEYDITCKDDVVSIDFSNLFSVATYEMYKDMEFEMSGENLQIPNNLSIGQSLPDANALMEVNISAVTMKTSVDITNRKVVSRENVTTDAGTFDCYLISYDTIVKSGMGLKQQGNGKQWITEKLGLIKQESYSGKGKLLGHSELTAYKGISQ